MIKIMIFFRQIELGTYELDLRKYVIKKQMRTLFINYEQM